MKILLGVLIGLIMAGGVAWATGFTNVIYQISDNNGSVSVFDDGNNKCYVATGWDFEGNAGNIIFGDGNPATPVSQSVAISCVRMK